MRRTQYLLGLILLLFSVPSYAFRITSYNTSYDIMENSTVIVTETIVADFTGDPRHGIYREIPLSGKDRYDNNYRLRFKILSVTDESGAELQYKKKSVSGGRINIRIGDPNTYVTGKKVYVIKYRLMRAIRYFRDHDELYANAIGSEWTVQIENPSSTVRLPKPVPKDKLMIASYTSSYGSKTSDAYVRRINGNTLEFSIPRPLNPGENLTIVVGWPKGITAKPSPLIELAWFAADNLYCFLPIVLIFALFFLWRYQGRDPDAGAPVAVVYEPPNGLSPAELGTLIDERVDMRDVSASIIDLAVRGFITIKPEVEEGFLRKKTDYLLKLVPPSDSITKDPNLSRFERDLLRNIFGGNQSQRVSLLKGTFYPALEMLRDDLYDSLVKKGYFANRPDQVRKSYQYGGWAMIGLGAAFIILPSFIGIQIFVSLGWTLSLIICGIILLIASRFMPKKTLKGAKALRDARGFEEYLSRAEKEEIVYQERQGYFEKFLPYAMAFGIAHLWAKAFDGLETVPPSWYEGDYQLYRPSIFANDMMLIANDLTYAMSTPPRTSGSSRGGGGFFGGASGFGGGGFSGGGFGGGGGGAW